MLCQDGHSPLVGTLSACDIPLTDAATGFAAAQIEAWNRAGIDPIKADEVTRARMRLACASVAGLGAIVRPNNDGAQRAILGFCGLVDQVAQ